MLASFLSLEEEGVCLPTEESVDEVQSLVQTILKMTGQLIPDPDRVLSPPKTHN